MMQNQCPHLPTLPPKRRPNCRTAKRPPCRAARRRLKSPTARRRTAQTVSRVRPRTANPPDGAPNGQPGGFGGSGEVTQGAGATSNTEDGDFYGINAALLATNGATVTIKNATVNSSAQNGNGVFSYGADTTVNISDSTITTSADNSGGIQTTGGGTTNAENLTVTTSGNSSAAIRSDRGGGTVNITGGSYTSNGYNSPAVYSTAAITVKNAKLTANNSELLVIEGKNSIALENCTVSGNMSSTKGSSSSENVHTVMIYQSMSGDADVGTSEFSMTGGSLIGKNGDLFYITNTHCILTLSGVTLKNEDPDGYLLRVVGNSASHGWGTAGSNGAQVEFTADAQTLEGNILVDTISTLDRLAHITQLLGCALKNPDFCLTLGILLRAELQQKRIAQPRT